MRPKFKTICFMDPFINTLIYLSFKSKFTYLNYEKCSFLIYNLLDHYIFLILKIL